MKTDFFCNDTDQVSLVERLDKLDIFLKNYCPTHFFRANIILDNILKHKNSSTTFTNAYIHNTYLGYKVKDGMLVYEEGSKREFLKAQGLFSRFINMEVINEFSFFMGNNRWIYVNINCFFTNTPKLSREFTQYMDDIKLQLMNLDDLIFIFGYSNVITQIENVPKYFSCFEYLLCLEEHVDTQTVIDKIKTELNLFRDKYEFSQDLIVKELKNKDELKCFFTGDYWFDCYPGENYIFCSQPGYFLSIYKFSHSVLEYYLLFSHIKNYESKYYIKDDAFLFYSYKFLSFDISLNFSQNKSEEIFDYIFSSQFIGIEENVKLCSYLYRLFQKTFLYEFIHVTIPHLSTINYDKREDSALCLEHFIYDLHNSEEWDPKLKNIKSSILHKSLVETLHVNRYIINAKAINKKKNESYIHSNILLDNQ